ncbi:MAG: hypothetical protein ABIQ88_01010 [Chitinophagaceae bacterium]
MLTYANKTTQHNYTIFHNQPIGKLLQIRLSQAEQLVTASEFHNPDLKLDICLNDGSNYPPLIEIIAGKAFARGFYNKVVLFGKADFENNFVELNGYRWNLTQLLVHEMIHCFQFDKLGIRQSNPIAKIDNWKWEGYPEYVARQNGDQKDLAQNIDRLLLTEKTDNHGWIQFSDSTGTVISYYKSWLLVKYCIDVKKMTYTQILTDKTREQMLQHQMERWYQQQK